MGATGPRFSFSSATAPGNLIAGPILTVGEEPHTVVTADLNGDGHLDLADSNRSDGTVTCLLGDGHGNFHRLFDNLSPFAEPLMRIFDFRFSNFD